MYYVFAGYQYYPSGGVYDYKGIFESKENALIYLASPSRDFDWWHITNEKLEIVLRNG